jgi:RNA polymerase sigma-70 factor, ECF subfamily
MVRWQVSLAARHDPDAWEYLYRRAYPRLFAYARRRLSSDAAADDAVSETMARALERIGTFTWKRAGFDAWLYGILRNVVFETYRSGARTAPLDHADDHHDGRVDDPAEIAEQAASAQMVRAAFDRLEEEEREVLELRVVGELSSNDVAMVLGKKPGAVRMAQSRATARLRQLVDEMERV